MQTKWLVLNFDKTTVSGKLYNAFQEEHVFSFEAQGQTNYEMMLSVAHQLQTQCDMNLLGIFVTSTELTELRRGMVDFGFELYDITTDLMEELNIVVTVQEEQIPFSDVSKVLQDAKDKATWELNYYGYLAGKQNRSQESLLSVGNGYIGVRGCLSEQKSSDNHYPATYIAGMYNKLTTKVADRDVENEDFVALPNWTYMQFAIDDEIIEIKDEMIKELNRTLDFKSGVLTIELLIQDEKGRRTRTITRRTASFSKMQLVAQSYTIIPQNYSGCIHLASIVDGDIQNAGVERYRSLNSQHLTSHRTGVEGSQGYMYVETTQSKFGVFMPFKHNVLAQGVTVSATSNATSTTTVFSRQNSALEPFTVEKIVTLVTSKEVTGDLGTVAYPVLHSVQSFAEVVAENVQSWKNNWTEVDIQIDGDILSQKILRLHTYHLLLSASQNNERLDASITARGLSGEAYRGHIFWDEIFILPFYNVHYPKTAKQILMYRYNRLDAARQNAKAHGYTGAMFPWQSGHSGGEETQTFALNPITGEWGPDYSSYQRHVSLAVAYDVWQYVHVTNDWDFMKIYGAEMMFEIARFWASKSVFNEQTGRYTIDQVMGPDEFHEGYPGHHGGGVRDNAYTNIMVAWLFEKIRTIGVKMGREFPEFARRIELSEAEYTKWQDIKTKLNIVIDEQGIIAQYDGYFDLKELDWEFYRNKYGNVYRMDRLLKAEGESADDYKVAKQADTLMTFYNLDRDVIENIFVQLGYTLPSNYLEENLKYYLARTSHGSTLSRIVHAKLAKMIDDEALSWQLYKEALGSDYKDIQGGTTAEGIHSGVMAATLDVAMTTFAGVNTRKEILEIAPKLPAHWNQIQFQVMFKGVRYYFNIQRGVMEVIASELAQINVHNQTYAVGPTKQTIQY
ncbi:MAG: glycoside hydrolase family 65 protein [Culicoidibacterales bacterium]